MLTRYGEQQYEKYYNILYNKVLTYCIKPVGGINLV